MHTYMYMYVCSTVIYMYLLHVCQCIGRTIDNTYRLRDERERGRDGVGANLIAFVFVFFSAPSTFSVGRVF